MAEVKLLIDAIQASKFITQTKSRELITKIKKFVSEHQAKQLQRQVFINDRVKNMNESVYYNVDDVYTAINDNKKIRFKYYKWSIEKKLVPRHNGDWFVASPQFFGWIFSLGSQVKVTGPDEVVAQMRKAAEEFKQNYL